MAQQAGEVAFGAGALRRLHRIGEAGDVAMQAVDLVQNGGALGVAEIGELAHLALERRVPVDAPAGRIDLGDRQQVGMLGATGAAAMAVRSWPAARHTGSPARPSAR